MGPGRRLFLMRGSNVIPRRARPGLGPHRAPIDHKLSIETGTRSGTLLSMPWVLGVLVLPVVAVGNGRSFRTLGLMLEKKQSPPAG